MISLLVTEALNKEGSLGRLTVELLRPQLKEAIAFLQSSGVPLVKEEP